MAEYNPSLLDFQRKAAEWARAGKTPPPADAYDPDALPFGKDAGANKLGLKVCATCAKPPTPTGRNDCPEAFLFRDEISAREYYISGMCQACQDSVFAEDEDEDEDVGPRHDSMTEEGPDDVVGHKTFATGPFTYRHEPLTRKEADAMWEAAEADKARRASAMPDEQAAIRHLFDAWLRLKELGWKEAIYCPKDGTEFQIIEAGSTGIFEAQYSGEWPDGYIVSRGDFDSYVSRPGGPILFRTNAPE